MSKLPPAGRTGKAFVRLPLEAWLPGVKEIAARHDISADSVVRFAAGGHPVFAVNQEFVVKLVPAFAHKVARREVDCLNWIGRCRTLPLPRLIGSGILEEWSYLVCTRLPGRPLSERWSHLDFTEQSDLAVKLGRVLAEFHQIPVDGIPSSEGDWVGFLAQRTAVWERRDDVGQLPMPLRESGLKYIESARLGQRGLEPVLMHGDLAPENCLVSFENGSWQISGIIDFGNARLGHAPFDLTAPTVLLAPGEGRIVGRLLAGYGLGREEIAQLRSQLMAYTLLHPMADLVQCLSLIPELNRDCSWDAVARAFWPDP